VLQFWETQHKLIPLLKVCHAFSDERSFRKGKNVIKCVYLQLISE
jgi:hypothetical protein